MVVVRFVKVSKERVMISAKGRMRTEEAWKGYFLDLVGLQ
jgi:hypothetical protein